MEIETREVSLDLVVEHGADFAVWLSCSADMFREGFGEEQKREIKRLIGVSFFHQEKMLEILLSEDIIENKDKIFFFTKKFTKILDSHINSNARIRTLTHAHAPVNAPAHAPTPNRVNIKNKRSFIYSNNSNIYKYILYYCHKRMMRDFDEKLCLSVSRGEEEYKKKGYIRQSIPLLSIEEELIEYWNSLKNVVKHTNKSTKTYQTAIKNISCLMKGTLFGRAKKSAEKFCRDISLSTEILSRPFSVEEIKLGFRKMSQIKRFPLSSMIYNPTAPKVGGMFSYFLFSFSKKCNTPVNGNGASNVVAPSLVEKFASSVTGVIKDKQEKELLSKRLAGVVEYYERMVLRQDSYLKAVVSDYLRNKTLFVQEYADFLCEQYKNWDNRIPPNVVGVNAKNWNKFLSSMKDKYFGDELDYNPFMVKEVGNVN